MFFLNYHQSFMKATCVLLSLWTEAERILIEKTVLQACKIEAGSRSNEQSHIDLKSVVDSSDEGDRYSENTVFPLIVARAFVYLSCRGYQAFIGSRLIIEPLFNKPLFLIPSV